MSAIFAALILAATGATPEHVGVVVVGGEPAQAGQIQARLESSLTHNARIEVVGIDRLAPILAGDVQAPVFVDDARAREAAAHIEKARDAFYRGQHTAAAAELSRARSIHDAMARVPARQEIRWWLWRAAVAQAVSRPQAAVASVRQALRLDPDLQVSLTEFKPSLSALVEQTRRAGLPEVAVRIIDAPAGAVVDVDDRRVSMQFRAVRGEHWIVVGAPGRRPVGMRVDLQGDAELSMPLALAIESELDTALKHGDAVRVRTVRERLGLETLVVVALQPPARGRVAIDSQAGTVEHDGSIASRQDVARLTRWAAGRIGDAREKRVTRESRRARWHASVDAGTALSLRTRRLEGDPGLDRNDRLVPSGHPDMPFFGTGPSLAGELAYGRGIAEGEATWVYYGLSTLRMKASDQATALEVGGGHALSMRGALGYRHPFGMPEVSPRLQVTAGMTYQRYVGERVQTIDGPQTLVSSYVRTGVEGRVSGQWPVAVGRLRLVFEGGAAVSPWSAWREDAPGFNGTRPQVLTTLGWDAGVQLAPMRGRWLLESRFHTETLRVQYSGTGSAPMSPAPTNALLSERVQGITIGARWGF